MLHSVDCHLPRRLGIFLTTAVRTRNLAFAVEWTKWCISHLTVPAIQSTAPPSADGSEGLNAYRAWYNSNAITYCIYARVTYTLFAALSPVVAMPKSTRNHRNSLLGYNQITFSLCSTSVFLNRRAVARYQAARGSPGICHFSFLSIFHE